MREIKLAAMPPLAQTGLDRDAQARTRPNLFDELQAEPATKVIPVWRGKIPIHDADGSLATFTVSDVPSAQYRVYLGRSFGSKAAYLTARLSESGEREFAATMVQAGVTWGELRVVGGNFDPLEAGLSTAALAVTNWHDTHGFCPNCGMPTTIESGGWFRRCLSDDFIVYPRIEPSMIVAVRDKDDRLLLGGGRPNWFTVAAGFVEPGESVEQTIVREVGEEAGLSVEVDGYLGSQSWPYPLSLMLAYSAVCLDEDPEAALEPDGVEIDHWRWFSREEFRVEAAGLLIPPRSSIARAMIEAWLGEPIGEPIGEPSREVA